MSSKQPRPEPVVVSLICSLCGEPWEAHGDDPTTLDCIRLLRAKPQLPSAFIGGGTYNTGGPISGTTHFLVGETGSETLPPSSGASVRYWNPPEDPPDSVPVAV